VVQINEVEPSRFRVGDLITIRGFGFAPTFGDNFVAIDGIPEPIQSESATEIQVFVPSGVQADAYVSVYVFRQDTLGNDSTQAWSKASLADLRDGTSQPPGQVPGTIERADPSMIEDTPQAQDYERMVTAIRHLLRDVLGTKGDLFANDGAGLVPHPVGGVAGRRLGANPATSTGMEYAAITRALSLAWGGRKVAGDTALNGLTANGNALDNSIVNGLHMTPATGTIYRLVIFFDGTAGDTLDQVTIRRNGITVWNSGTGVGLTPGNVLATPVSIAVVGGTDTIEVQAKKLGTNGDGYMIASVGIR
jgi:hypothetical protein